MLSLVAWAIHALPRDHCCKGPDLMVLMETGSLMKESLDRGICALGHAHLTLVMQEALLGGAMSAAELRQWLALAARPILGALSRYPCKE